MKKLTILAVVILPILTAVANVSLATDFPSAFISELSQKEGHYYEVKRGESFWKIAEDRLGDPLMHNLLFELNKDRLRLQNPKGLRAGQKVFIPGPENGEKEKVYYLEAKLQIDKAPQPSLAKSLNAPAIIISILLLNIIASLSVRKSKRELTFFSFLFLLSLYFVLEPVPVSTYTLSRIEVTEYNPEPKHDEKERMKAERMAFIRRTMIEFQLSLAAEELDKKQEWSERWLNENGKLKQIKILDEGVRYGCDNLVDYIFSGEVLGQYDNAIFFQRMENYKSLVRKACEQYGLHPALVGGVIKEESTAYWRAKSHAGALGLMQIMPATAKERYGVQDTETIFNPEININMGSDYLKYLWERFGNIEEALAGYNWGPENVKREGVVPKIKKDFVDKVLRNSEELMHPFLKTANYSDLWNRA